MTASDLFIHASQSTSLDMVRSLLLLRRLVGYASLSNTLACHPHDRSCRKTTPPMGLVYVQYII